MECDELTERKQNTFFIQLVSKCSPDRNQETTWSLNSKNINTERNLINGRKTGVKANGKTVLQFRGATQNHDVRCKQRITLS